MNTMQGNTVPVRVAIGFERMERDPQTSTGCHAGVTGAIGKVRQPNFSLRPSALRLVNAAGHGLL